MSTEHESASWHIVMAELTPGTASVGIRLGKQEMVQFFVLDTTPEQAARLVADIARGYVTLKDIAAYSWRAVLLPYKEAPDE